MGIREEEVEGMAEGESRMEISSGEVGVSGGGSSGSVLALLLSGSKEAGRSSKGLVSAVSSRLKVGLPLGIIFPSIGFRDSNFRFIAPGCESISL